MNEHESGDGPDLTFDSLMARMGVKRIKGQAKAVANKRPRKDQRGQEAAEERAPRAKVAPVAPEVEPVAPPPAVEPAPAVAPAVEAPAAEPEPVEPAVQGAEVTDLRRLLLALADERDAMAEEISHLRSLLAGTRLEALGLRAQVGADLHPGAPAPSLSDVLSNRGIMGADEAAFLLRALAESRLLGELVPLLAPADAGALSSFLRERVCLLCGAATCPAPSGRVRLVVPAARCEVCGGGDVARAIRRFIDGCLVHGFTRVAIAGGAPIAHRQLREMIEHRSVSLRLVPGDPALAASRSLVGDTDLDLVVVWGSAPRVQGSGVRPRLLRAQATTIAGMLEEVAERLLADE